MTEKKIPGYYTPSWDPYRGQSVPCPPRLQAVMEVAWDLLEVRQKLRRIVLETPTTSECWGSVARVLGHYLKRRQGQSDVADILAYWRAN